MTPSADTALRDLALRLLRPHPADTAPQDAHLFVGHLPPDLPVPLPMPPASRLLGSHVERGGVAVTSVLDSDLPPEDVYAFYHQELPAAGWTELTFQLSRGGFSAPGRRLRAPRAEVGYCYGATGPALAIRAGARPGHPTDVRVILNMDTRHTPCGGPWSEEGTVQLLPDLVAPATGHLRPQSSSYGGSEATARATLETVDDLATVAAHYARQLEGAGWTRHGGEQEGALDWSTWTRDEAGQAIRWGVLTLSILRQPEVRWQNGSPTLDQRPQVVWQYALEGRVQWHAQG